MVERFLSQTSFTSQEDFIKNLKINVPENFNFGYDVVDAWAAEHPDKPALLWTNDKGEHIQFSFADMKRYTDMTASYFQSLGIGHGDTVKVSSNRGYIKAKAVVTKRIRTLKANGKDIDTIGIPIHWGYEGVAKKGFIANTLTPFVGDANTQTPEFKSFLVNVEKV